MMHNKPMDAPHPIFSPTSRVGSIAAFGNAFAASAALYVALFLIGIPAMGDPQQLAELAIHNPTPLLLQDALKFLSAATACVLIFALDARLRDRAPTWMRAAKLFGFLAVGLLLANATLSLFLVLQTTRPLPIGLGDHAALNGVIGILGMAAIMANGVWYLVVNWTARTSQRLPRGLCYLGLLLGVASLMPFLALFVLILGIVWALGLGVVLGREK